MDALKYVVTDRGAFAIFNGLQAHNDVARSLYGKPIGAGFVRVQVGVRNENIENPEIKNTCILITCYGRSVSLNLESRGEEDENIINKNI